MILGTGHHSAGRWPPISLVKLREIVCPVVQLLTGRTARNLQRSESPPDLLDTFQPDKMAVREVIVDSKRYTEEFNVEAVRRVVEHGIAISTGQCNTLAKAFSRCSILALAERHSELFNRISLLSYASKAHDV